MNMSALHKCSQSPLLLGSEPHYVVWLLLAELSISPGLVRLGVFWPILEPNLVPTIW